MYTFFNTTFANFTIITLLTVNLKTIFNTTGFTFGTIHLIHTLVKNGKHRLSPLVFTKHFP